MSKAKSKPKLKLKPEILRENGEPKFAVLSYEQYLAVLDALEDADDLATLRAARKSGKNDELIPWDDAKKLLNTKKTPAAKRRKTA